MRILAIGDIHGCSRALDLLLEEVQPAPDDIVVTLGDYVDRGPDSRGVIERVIALGERLHLVALRGNHEEMMLEARFDARTEGDWIEYGGDTTSASYGSIEAIPDAHWRFLEQQCVDLWEMETHFFVHGNAYPDVPLSEQPAHILRWGRFDNAQPHESGKIMVCGHTSQKSGLPNDRGFAVCIDTWAYGKGWLSCLDVATGQIWQADQRGQQRRLRLDERI